MHQGSKYAKRCHLIVINKLVSKIGKTSLRECVASINEALPSTHRPFPP